MNLTSGALAIVFGAHHELRMAALACPFGSFATVVREGNEVTWDFGPRTMRGVPVAKSLHPLTSSRMTFPAKLAGDDQRKPARSTGCSVTTVTSGGSVITSTHQVNPSRAVSQGHTCFLIDSRTARHGGIASNPKANLPCTSAEPDECDHPELIVPETLGLVAKVVTWCDCWRRPH